MEKLRGLFRSRYLTSAWTVQKTQSPPILHCCVFIRCLAIVHLFDDVARVYYAIAKQRMTSLVKVFDHVTIQST
jgi:hypothetical protein